MDDIQQYWNRRAQDANGDPSATTNDVYLRKLESIVVSNELRQLIGDRDAQVLDVGCGDGRTTLAMAALFPNATFSGVDFSSDMISAARIAGREHKTALPVEFFVGDARNLVSFAGDRRFDVILTNQCLINIPERPQQWGALDQISKHLENNGCYLGTENFLTGQNNLNALRKTLDLPEIPIRWHNLYFDEV